MDLSKYLGKTVLYNGNKYTISVCLYNQIDSMGIKFDEKYVSYLLQHNPIDARRCISTLIHMDIDNRKYIGTYGTYGKIIKLDKKGNTICSFETVIDAVLDSPNQSIKYSFEKLHKNGISQEKEKCIFFGKNLTFCNDAQDTLIIKALNKTILKCKNIYADRNDTWKKNYAKINDPSLTYSEFLMQWIRATAFECGNWISYSLSPISESKYTLHNVDKCSDYTERIDNLFSKYSNDGKTAFLRVYDLNQTINFSGIYLLCLPQIKGCYLGKTNKTFDIRIPQHFTKPNSSFDIKYKPEDIREIYVLPLDETMYFIDFIEEDCIATLGPNICLNAFAGGTSTELIKSETYMPERHFIKQDLVNWIVKDSIEYVSYIYNCKYDN